MRMLNYQQRWTTLLVLFVSAFIISACVPTNVRGDGGDYFRLTKRDAASYEEAGKWWGTYHFALLENGRVKWNKKCGQVDQTPCKRKLKNGEKSIKLHP